MFRKLTILAFLASITTGCAATVPSRTGAEGLLRELDGRQELVVPYEEYQSFVRTVDAAAMTLHAGRAAEAEGLYGLAVTKGNIIKQKINEKEGRRSSPPAAPISLLSVPAERAAPGKEVPLTSPIGTVTADSAGGLKTPLPATAGTPPVDMGAPLRKDSRTGLLSDRIVGGEGFYRVERKETLRVVGSRLGVNWRLLARQNRLNPDRPLQPGQKIRYNNRKIVPKKMKDGIVVNIPERKLYFFKDNQLQATYPVAAGMAKKKEKTIWRTPTGKFTIIDKTENPSWRVPLSIRKEMEEEGEEVLDVVPPGPMNPLGRYAVKTSLTGIMIHSTIRPASIDTYSSHGCIRVMPEHMETLFRDLRINMPGEIIYQPVKIAVTDDGRVFLEVNHDVYERLKDLREEVKRLVAAKGAADIVSWEMIKRVINERSGIAEEVTRQNDVVVATIDPAAE